MHDLRCEHSTSDPKRCRCTQCGGSKHGIQATAETGTYSGEQTPGLLYPGLGDDLKRAGQQLAAYREAMFAESGVHI